jgi:hypothetical protein
MEGRAATVSEDYKRDGVNESFHYKTYHQVIDEFGFIPEGMGLQTPSTVNNIYQVVHARSVEDSWSVE